MTEKFRAQLASSEDIKKRGLGSPGYFGEFIGLIEQGFPKPPSFAERIGINQEDLDLIKEGKAAIPDKVVVKSWANRLNLDEDDKDDLLVSAGYTPEIDSTKVYITKDLPLPVAAGALRYLSSQRVSKFGALKLLVRKILN